MNRLRSQTPQCSGRLQPFLRIQPVSRTIYIARRPIVIRAQNWWEQIGDKLKGGGGPGGNKEDAARRAIQDSFSAKKFGGQQQKPQTPQQAPQTVPGGGGAGGMFGGSGGGGGGGFGGASEGSGPEKSFWQEFVELMQGIWVVLVNTVIFLAFANMLHRSLDWCCQIELLMLVGAPQQAFERVASVFYSWIEAFEKNVLGWDIPGDDDMIPMYENLALFYPEEHAYTFDSYRYDMTEAEKKKLKYFYALRHYERDGGVRGEVDAQDVQAIVDKYEPMEADRRAYQRAKSQGKLKEYWEDKKEVYKKMVRGSGGVGSL